ncbi:EAL domain-containing protein [Rhodoferax sp.]|uniref:bifunctional diguanylate cyclase/phosphodiesterase n=1 Tax=Rhodoferax sp. TaxID=50421 RepID=UPI0025CCFCBD|nr:EAL domain-containing protein [Rhodoferax sp.]
MKITTAVARWGVGTKFVAFSLVLLLLIQAAVYGVVQVNIERNVRGQVKQELVTGERFWWQLLDQNAQRLRFGAEVVAKDFGFRSALGSGDIETLRSTLENHGGRVNATVTAYLDPQFELKATGFEIAAQDKLSPVLHRVANELGSNDLTYKIEQIDAKLFQFVMVPVKAPLTIGWVLMGFSLEQSQADAMFELSHVHIALLSKSRSVLLSSLPQELNSPLQELGSSGDLQLSDDTLVIQESAARPQVKGIDTYVLRSLDEVVAPYRKVQLALLLITAIGLGLFALGSTLLAQRVTVPLRSLAGAAEQLSRGDYSQALPAMRHRDEVGDLSRAFNKMRGSIQAQQHEIMQLAYWDRLTGLPNRTQFRDLIKQSIQASVAGGGEAQPVTVIMLNLDRFKHVNDVLGYAFGDRLLKAVAERLAAQITPEQGTVARLGGDEFGVMVEDLDAHAATHIAAQISKAFEAPLRLEDQTVDLSAGIGVASWPMHAQDVDMLLSRAEIAMYVAKRKTTGTQVYDPALDSSSTQTLSLLTELRHAVEDGQLRLYLQPKLNLADNTVVSAEALVRWQHPVRGLVPPMQFIPFAEQTGFVRQLTLWMFEEVAKELPRLRADGRPLRIAINLSTRDLLDQEFPAKLDAMMLKHNAPTSAYCLEITESAIMDDPERAEATLNRLSERGFKLSIDDFGTGYSSLAYLKRLPVNELKIDKSFVMGMERDESDAKIVRSTIDLAHNLGLSVVAEGVENQAILDKLSELHCDEAQGYHMSRPIPLPEFIAWRAAHLARTGA